MRNKILIVEASGEEREQLELILQEVVQMGTELIFAEKREQGLELILSEHPQLVFLDSQLVGKSVDDWVQAGTHIVMMQKESERGGQKEDFVAKPLQTRQVLEKCRSVFGTASAPPLPPM